jgi:hypothetical protein
MALCVVLRELALTLYTAKDKTVIAQNDCYMVCLIVEKVKSCD